MLEISDYCLVFFKISSVKEKDLVYIPNVVNFEIME